MKKFYIALILLLSFLITPVFSSTCEAMDIVVHQTLDHKDSHQSDNKLKKCHDYSGHHHHSDRAVLKEATFTFDAAKASFPLPSLQHFSSLVIDPLLKPPAA